MSPSLDAWPQLAAAARKSSGNDEEAFIGQVAWLCRVRELAARGVVEPFFRQSYREILG